MTELACGLFRRERGCRGRRHRTMAKSEVPEDCARTPRWPAIEPKLHSLGVAEQFGHVVESAENARRGRRACQTEPPRAHGASARRWLGLVRVGPEEAACEALQRAITHHDQRLLMTHDLPNFALRTQNVLVLPPCTPQARNPRLNTPRAL